MTDSAGETTDIQHAADALNVPVATLRRLTDEPRVAAAQWVTKTAPDATARDTAMQWLEHAHPEVDA